MVKQINGLRLLRYSVTEHGNVLSVRGFALPALATFTVTMSSTYGQLIEHHLARLQKTTKPEAYNQVSKNHLTALRAFMRNHQRSETTSIGSELAEEFDSAVKAHLAGSDLSERTRADRRSILNAWRLTFVEQGLTSDSLSRTKARRIVTESGQTPFESTLKAAIKQAKTTAKAAARKAGICTSALQRWTSGAIPNVRTVDTLHRLDAVLGLETGTLAKALAQTTQTSATKKFNPQGATAYRERQSQRVREPYHLKEHELTPQFLQEWRRLFDYKTSIRPAPLLRSASGRWALTDAKLSAIKPNQLVSRGNAVSASAAVAWARVAGFLGFLRLPIERGGYGVAADQAQALAWLADAQAVNAYMQFLADRSGGVCHTGHRVFAGLLISLTNPKTGYLTQCPQLFERLPADVLNGRSPADMCHDACEMARAWKPQASSKSRNPLDPIRSLVELDEPLAPVLQAMGTLRRIGNAAAAGSKTELLARRDELILGLLIACPLRAKNLQTLTYNPNNTGSIYRTGAGQWRVRIELANLKNGKSKKALGVYDVPLPGWLNGRLDDYVATVRPLLVGGRDSGYLLLTEDGNRLDSLTALVVRITRSYVPGCMGFGPHSFRHIVATDWLKKHPNDFLTVSELLGDTIETVIREYAHLKQDTAFSRYEAYVSGLL